jgi:hypothetical protein
MRAQVRVGLLAGGLVLVTSLVVVAMRVAVPRAQPVLSVGNERKAGQFRTLRTGKVIWVISEHVFAPSKAGATPELVIRYRTRIDEHDQEGWVREVQEIWPDYVPEAERAGLSEIVIWPTRPEAVVDGLGAVGIAGAFDVTKDASGKSTCAICDMYMNAVRSKPDV